MDHYFEEMLSNGAIVESTFDFHHIPKNTDSKGNSAEKSNDISLKNRHCAKILNCKVQIRERRKLIDAKRIKEYETKKLLFESENRDYELNFLCEKKIDDLIVSTCPDIHWQYQDQSNQIEFDDAKYLLSMTMLSEIMNVVINLELKAFVRVCSLKSIRGGQISYINVSSKKTCLVKQCTLCLFCIAPTYPDLLEPENVLGGR